MKWLIYLLPFCLVACSSLPKTIQDPPIYDLQLEAVAGRATTHENQAVRWGGKIVSVNNDNQQSLVQLVHFPLNSYGKPIVGKVTQGRFLVQTTQFLDPEIYKVGRLATFSGIILSEQTRLIDKKTLYLPVIQMTESHLWLQQPKMRPYYPDQFLYPYYSHGFHGRRYFSPYRNYIY